MNYVKYKEVAEEFTTLSLKPIGNVIVMNYYGEDGLGYKYAGIDIPADQAIDLAASQDPKISCQLIGYEEAYPIIKNCWSMKSFNQIIEKKIGERYSIGEELKLRDLASDNPDRVEYEAFKASIKAEVNLRKQAFGLIL